MCNMNIKVISYMLIILDINIMGQIEFDRMGLIIKEYRFRKRFLKNIAALNIIICLKIVN